jgi:hypothetical protein
LLSTARIWAGKNKHAGHCAPTLLRSIRGFGLGDEVRSKAEVLWLKSEVSKKKVSHTNLFSCEALSS